MKHPLICLMFLLTILTCSLSRAQLLTDENRVLAIVGETVFTSMDVEEKLKTELDALKSHYRGKELQQKAKQLLDMTLEAMINQELVYLDFKSLKTDIPSHLVQERIDQAIANSAAGDAIRFEEALYAQGMTMKEFREKIHKTIATELLLRSRVKAGISISDDLVEQFYNQHRFDMVKPNRYHLAVILLKKTGKNIGKIQETVKTIQQELAKKVPFPALAKRFSDGPNADRGGDLGWMESPAPALLKAVKELNAGETNAKPFAIGDNLYFVHVLEKSGGGIPLLDDKLRASLKATLIKQEELKRYKAYLKELHMKYPIRRTALFIPEN